MVSRYTREELHAVGVPPVYACDRLRQISFPLGGIGTGSVGLTGGGNFKDWEIFNRPNFGSWFPQTFPLIYAKASGHDPVAYILEGPVAPPLIPLDGGKYHNNAEGLPHVESTEFRGEFPIARVTFHEERLPVAVELEAYNPFVPGDPDASGFPAGILKYKVSNPGNAVVDVVLAWSLRNLVGTTYGEDPDRNFLPLESAYGKNVNTLVHEGDLQGVLFTGEKYPAGDPHFGSVALVTPTPGAVVAKHWPRKIWFESLGELWTSFAKDGTFPQYDLPPTVNGQTDAGVVGARLTIAPGETKTVTFYITWHFPTFEKYWASEVERGPDKKRVTWQNYYAKHFKDALDVARQLHAREADLYAKTRAFHDALFQSTLPPYVLDAVSANLGILKTSTILRLPDGTLYGFEGTNATTGCCEGSCTHVYNYEQVIPFLFPSLERGMREADYAHNFLGEEGALNFRIVIPFTAPESLRSVMPCADGQMGDIIKVYRDWKICGDDAWVRKMWPSVKKALEFAWVEWDEDKDGKMEGSQHNTYDVNFQGPNSMIESIYLGALRAAEEMARVAGDEASAGEYRRIYAQGRKWTDEHLFNGEYYFQQYDDEKQHLSFQYGPGCLSDQVVGQCYAAIAGLGDILDPEHVKLALQAVFKYNWKPSLRAFANYMRLYAVNDEAALVICTWPRGGRPKTPMPYADEAMNGFEYQVATHCILVGLLDEGLAIVKGIRDRYDGLKRNPWDEFECGHHYARSMASYGLLIALVGFQYDAGAGFLGFTPKLPAQDWPAGVFRCLWSLARAWGTFAQAAQMATVDVLSGEFALKAIRLGHWAGRGQVVVTCNQRAISLPLDASGTCTLPEPVLIRPGNAAIFELQN